MQLKEFVADQRALLDEFERDYEQRRKKRGMTLFRPEEEWREFYQEFLSTRIEPQQRVSDGYEEDPKRACA